MNSVREYRMPLIIAGGAIVIALLIWVVLVAPQNSKLSSLATKETQLTSQQSSLEAKLASLKSEKQQLTSSCADLQKIATQIPSVESPTDVDSEESSFESQFNALTASSGVTLTQFSGFAPSTGGSSSTPVLAPAHTGATDVTAVPTTLTVTGNYGQISAFINALDTFPRLFVIQTFVLAGGSGAATAPSPGSASPSGSSSAAGGTPLWTGGAPTAAAAGPYSVTITGSIYYTSAPNALDACTKATASLK
jgi:Tfp pilus assembly protein PilO